MENVTFIRHVEVKADRERQRITYLTIRETLLSAKKPGSCGETISVTS